MSKDSKIGLTGKQAAFCQEYIIDHNGKEAAIRAGYSKNGAKVIGCNLLTHINCKAEIDRLTAQRQAKAGHNYNIAVNKLLADYENLKDKAATGDIQAIQARTAIIRELNDISGLHKQVIRQEIAAPALTEAEKAALPDAAHTYKLRLAKGG